MKNFSIILCPIQGRVMFTAFACRRVCGKNYSLFKIASNFLWPKKIVLWREAGSNRIGYAVFRHPPKGKSHGEISTFQDANYRPAPTMMSCRNLPRCRSGIGYVKNR